MVRQAIVWEYNGGKDAVIIPLEHYVGNYEVAASIVYNNSVPSSVLISQYNEMDFHRRNIQAIMAVYFNSLNTLIEQLEFINLFPEIKVEGEKVYFHNNNIKLNDLWQPSLN